MILRIQPQRWKSKETQKLVDSTFCKDYKKKIFFHLNFIFFILFFKDLCTYLFLEKGEGKEKERERNINVWLPLTWPHWEPGPQPRHVHWLGIEPATLWLFIGLRSGHWATPARAPLKFYKNLKKNVRDKREMLSMYKWKSTRRTRVKDYSKEAS